METVSAEIERRREVRSRNREGRSQWCFRMGCIAQGLVMPDPRNQEQQDLGVQLEWRLLKRHYELKAGVERQ